MQRHTEGYWGGEAAILGPELYLPFSHVTVAGPEPVVAPPWRLRERQNGSSGPKSEQETTKNKKMHFCM